VTKCENCPHENPEAKHCQSCYLAEKTRRERLEKSTAKLLHYIDQVIEAVKGI
jgi:hypothetical protein